MWFKQLYVWPILSGEKTDTIRLAAKRHPKVGVTVDFSVGPRPPFCRARIVAVEPVAIHDLDDDRASQVRATLGHGALDAPLVRIAFEVEHVYSGSYDCIATFGLDDVEPVLAGR